ncbi:MAG TPA: alkaline phosphatase family protein [Gemmatimonadales bacterium]
MAPLPPGLDRFDHLVVLMLENRSFDNLLGYLYEHDRPARFIGRGEPAYRGVAGRSDLANLDSGTPPRRIPVQKAPWQTPRDMINPCPDPGEFYQPHVNHQLYGVDQVPGDSSSLPDPAPMSGFVQDYQRAIREELLISGIEPTFEHYSIIMNCFPPEAVPVLSALARQFAVSDEWFGSVPSATFSNRSFLHSGQSHGFVHNQDFIKWRHNDAPTVFERLTGQLGPGRDWRVYWDHADIYPVTRGLHRSLHGPEWNGHFVDFKRFADDCRRGDLPAYSFIQPRVLINHNDMHPPVWLSQKAQSSILAGEELVKDVYDAVRTSPAWLRTLLVITFDEHGGTYDHWPPPRATPPFATSPWPPECGFHFDRFGVRVPTIMVSPYIAPGTVVRAPGAVPFDHTSIIATLSRRFGLAPLTDRDRAAPDLGGVHTLGTAEARKETPPVTARPYVPLSAEEAHDSILSGFQKGFGHLVAHLLGRDHPAEGVTRVRDLVGVLGD